VRTGSPLTQFVIEYRENDGHSLRYSLENLVAGAIDDIDVALIGPWDSPNTDERIDVKRKEQIAERIVAAVKFLGDEMRLVHTRAGY
jgi:hypothetical protein